MKNGRNKIHPGLLVCLVALSTVAGLFLIRYLTPHRVEANVTLLERASAQPGDTGPNLPNLFNEKLGTGESYVAANRVTELSDFVLRIGLFRFKSEMTRRIPLTFEGVIDGLRQDNHLPAHIHPTTEPGKLNTPYSTLYVRYRAIPFAVEVVSIPRSERKGGAMLLRLPADPNEAVPVQVGVHMEMTRLIEGVSTNPQAYYAYYTSSQTTSAQLPLIPFAPTEQMLNYGWNKQNMPQPARLNAQQLAELKHWLDKVQ
jgi:hypothetical protein